MTSRAAQALTLTLAILCAAFATAHDARPIFVQVQEIPGGDVLARWNVPASVPLHALPVPTLPDHCVAAGEPLTRAASGGYQSHQKFACAASISGATLGMRFPDINPSLTTVFRVELAGGERHTGLLRPGDASWLVPADEDRLNVARQYTVLGIRHIAGGVDHLLFVGCLLWIARTPRRLLITITGFTLAHSLTLALSALGIVRLPVAPVEAAIALSVMFLAVEIARGDRASWTHRYPVAVSSLFGLLHGFGFAAVLRQIGLPQTELPTALLFFNVGVEIGQVLFIALLVVAYLALHAARTRRPAAAAIPAWERLGLPASYVVGPIAGFWLIDRVAGFWA